MTTASKTYSVPLGFHEQCIDYHAALNKMEVTLAKDHYILKHPLFGEATMDWFAAWQLAMKAMPLGHVPPPEFFKHYPEHSADILNYRCVLSNRTRVARLLKGEPNQVRGFVSTKFVDVDPYQVNRIIDRFNDRTEAIGCGRLLPVAETSEGLPNLEAQDPLFRRTMAELVGNPIEMEGEVYKPLVRISTGHVGMKAFHIEAGIWRQVCTNGLIVPLMGAFDAMRGKHVGDVVHRVMVRMEKVAENLQRVPVWVRALEQTRGTEILSADEEDELLSDMMLPIPHLKFLCDRYGRQTRKTLSQRKVVVARTLYGLIDAATQWSQLLNYDTRQSVEARVGGFVLSRYEAN